MLRSVFDIGKWMVCRVIERCLRLVRCWKELLVEKEWSLPGLLARCNGRRPSGSDSALGCNPALLLIMNWTGSISWVTVRLHPQSPR